MTNQNNAAQPVLTDDQIEPLVRNAADEIERLRRALEAELDLRAEREKAADPNFVMTELRGIICVAGDSSTVIVSVERMRLWLSKLRAPVAEEPCKRCGGPGWYTSHTTGYPESIPCSACNPQGVSAERLEKDPFLAAQLWRKPVDFADAYEGAREDLAIWKRRALEAERDLRAERETSSRLVAELNAENGPMRMGGPAALAGTPVAGEAQPAAYLTLDEEGSPSMLFFDVVEARTYCELGDEPEPLFRRSALVAGDANPQAPAGWRWTLHPAGLHPDVYAAAAARDSAEDVRNAALEEAAHLMEQTGKRIAASDIRALKSTPAPTAAEVAGDVDELFEVFKADRQQRAGDEPTCDVGHAHFTPFYLLSNARRLISRPTTGIPNWALASNLFAVGSTTARRICRDAGIDPEGATITSAALSAASQDPTP